MKQPFSTLALLWGLLAPFNLFPQSLQLDSSGGIFGILQQYNPLQITIETSIKQLKEDKTDEQWQPGIFKVMKGDSVALQLDIRVAARGNMRKKTCDFPPVKIRFYNEEPENDSIADINELKLVTSCKKSALNEEWVQKECLLYELYNLVTEQSFRVKPATVRFEDPEKKGRSQESFSFFIESEKELAARLNGRPTKPKIVSNKVLDSVSFDRMCLYEYMIGNTDFSARSRHNVKLIYLYATQSLITVPYDFDYAGVVGTDYAVPNGDYPIQTVQDRYYLGACRSKAHYQQIFDLYLSKKEAMIAHCEQFAYLPKSTQKQMVRYFEAFFEVLKSPSLARREILQNCNKGR